MIGCRVKEFANDINESEKDIANDRILENIFEHIDKALALAGYDIIDGDEDSIIIRNAATDSDFIVRVMPLPN